ncbi:hypothetical protein J3458_002861 [Metarhizium acridum]|uniref:uncharacterized protein n=1 Tax=Metarhizium acridum TaxID=92637 RepID=UPI001C6D0C9E|nr:hypothetical protein J3458_002861 [Metarhizium acridum]
MEKNLLAWSFLTPCQIPDHQSPGTVSPQAHHANTQLLQIPTLNRRAQESSVSAPSPSSSFKHWTDLIPATDKYIHDFFSLSFFFFYVFKPRDGGLQSWVPPLAQNAVPAIGQALIRSE